jgi:hypothetical protein
MPLRPLILPLFLLVAGSGSAPAQQGHKIDLQQDALLGPVKSVVTSRLSEASPEMQKKMAFSAPPICEYCEYDEEGNKIANGRLVEGKFYGDRTVLQRNPDGLIERVTTTEVGPLPPTSTPPRIMLYQLDGPFGRVDSTTSFDGTMQFHTAWAYDTRGNVSDVRQFDQNGLVNHEIYKWTEDGQRTDQEIHGKGDVLLWRLTWDPSTDVNRYTCFDPSGALLESWTTQADKVVSFFEASDEPGPCHTYFMFQDNPNGDFVRFFFRKAGESEVTHSYSKFLGPGKQNIRHTDFHDSTGKLVRASDYQYEFDSRGNWTHRKVWVTIPGDPAPILFAEDTRTITYWDK